MSPEAPMKPIELRPRRLVLLRDHSIAHITHVVDSPEPFELLGTTIAADERPTEPLLWQSGGQYSPDADMPHYLDIVGIEIVPDQPTTGGAVFAPFLGMQRKGQS